MAAAALPLPVPVLVLVACNLSGTSNPCDTFVGQVRIGGLPSGSCSTCRTSRCYQVVCLQWGPWAFHKLAQPLCLNSVVVGVQGAFCVIVFASHGDE